MLHNVLKRYTDMPVKLITEELLIQPNHVFIIPEQHDLSILEGKFHLSPLSKPIAALGNIKEAGGITIAQKPDTSLFPDMPNSAIASGYIDFILSPENIAQEIARITHAAPGAE